MLSLDTTREAEAVYFDALRRLGTAGRVRKVFELNQNLRALAAGGVRSRHPDYDESQVQLAVVRLFLGERLFREVFPGDDTRP